MFYVLFTKDEKSKFDFISWKEFIFVLILLFASVLICFLYIPVISIKLLPAYKAFFISHYFGIFMYFLSSILSLYIIYYFCCKRKKKSLVSGLFLNNPSKKIYLYSVIIGFLMPIVSLPLIFKFAPKQFYAMNLLSQEGGLIFLIFSATLAPISEEVFYRGFVFPFFQSKTNSFLGIILTAVFFSISHFFNVGGAFILLGLFVFYGLVLTFIRYFTNSLIPPIIIHLIHNATLMGAFFIAEKSRF